MYVGVGPKSTLASILQLLQKTLQLSVVSSATALLVERRQLLRMEPCTFPATRCHAFSTVESHAERSGAGKVGRADGGQQALSSQTLITNTLPCCQFQRRQSSPGSMGSSGRHHHPSAAHPAIRSREVWPRSTMDNTVKGREKILLVSTQVLWPTFFEADMLSSRSCRSRATGLPAAQSCGSRWPTKADRQGLGRDEEGAWSGRLLLVQ